jgi:hypothetical protein
MPEQLTYNMGNTEYQLADSAGNITRFWDFSGPANQQGQFKSFTDRYGNVTTANRITNSSDPNYGKITNVTRTATVNSTTYTEQLVFSYYSSGDNSGYVSNISYQQQINGGAWNTIRQVAYVYYGSSESYGTQHDLKYVNIEDGSTNILQTKYYRYFVTGDTGGYPGGLRDIFEPDSYARLKAAFADPTTQQDSAVAPYADRSFQYSTTSPHNVTQVIVQGAGTSLGAGDGRGTYTFSYNTTGPGGGVNSWSSATTEGFPNGSSQVIYANFQGQVMLRSLTTSSGTYDWFTKYDTNTSRVIMKAYPTPSMAIAQAMPIC